MPLRASILLLVLTAAATRAIGAQAADFATLNDSLSRIDDSLAVRRLEQARRPARNAPAPDHVAHGLIALRLYELTGNEATNRLAKEAFERAIQRDRALSWAHFGLGKTLASSAAAKPMSEGGKRGFFVLDDVARKIAGRDARSRARAAYRRALSSAPPAEPAARELAELSLSAPARERLQEARSALQNLSKAGAASALDLAALTRVHTALGDTAAANDAADAALAAAPTTATRYAAARAWLLGNRAEAGARLLFDALRNATAHELTSFYEDVVPVANEAEKARWETGDAEARRRLLLDFWDLRAGLAGVTVAQRLTAHFERLRYADQHFLRMHEFPPPDPSALRIVSNATLSRFDDRGDFFIRHGRPDQEIFTRKDSGIDFLSWAYRQPDQSTRLIHFFRDGPDFRLAGRIPCDQEFLSDRAGYDARLGLASVRCDQLRMMSYSAEYREFALAALATDSHYPRFARELPFFYDLYTFRGAEHKTAVVAAFAVPAAALETTPDDRGVRYRFDVSLIVADTAIGSVSRTDDSASIKLPGPLPGSELLRTHLEVNMEPSPSTLQRVIVTDPTEPGIGQLYGGPFPIPDYTGTDLMLSDIALGLPSLERAWKRGSVSLALVPTSQFPGGNFSVYYEIYNLPAGTKYSTEIVIERIDKNAAARLRGLFGASGDVRFRFGGESTAGPDHVLPELRRIEAPLGRGRYRMTVIVKDLSTGLSARQSRIFVIPD